jgi:hypothetical protein
MVSRLPRDRCRPVRLDCASTNARPVMDWPHVFVLDNSASDELVACIILDNRPVADSSVVPCCIREAHTIQHYAPRFDLLDTKQTPANAKSQQWAPRVDVCE